MPDTRWCSRCGAWTDHDSREHEQRAADQRAEKAEAAPTWTEDRLVVAIAAGLVEGARKMSRNTTHDLTLYEHAEIAAKVCLAGQRGERRKGERRLSRGWTCARVDCDCGTKRTGRDRREAKP